MKSMHIYVDLVCTWNVQEIVINIEMNRAQPLSSWHP